MFVKSKTMYDLTQHYRAPQAPPNLHAYAQHYQQSHKPSPSMRQQMRRQSSQNRPMNIRQQVEDEDDEIARARVQRLHALRNRAKAKKGKTRSRHWVYSTFEEGGRTFVAFEKPMFMTMILLLSLGIGVLAIDFRKFLHFIGHTIRKSVSAVTS